MQTLEGEGRAYPFFVYVLSIGCFAYFRYTPTDARARRELSELDALFHINDSDPFYASRRYDLRRTGYIVVTGAAGRAHPGEEWRAGNGEEMTGDGGGENEDILKPATLKGWCPESGIPWRLIGSALSHSTAAAHLWSLVQSLAVEYGQSQQPMAYSSLCVHFPLAESLKAFVESRIAGQHGNGTRNANESADQQQQFCVSNPLLELFQLAMKDNKLADDQFAHRLASAGDNNNSTPMLSDDDPGQDSSQSDFAGNLFGSHSPSSAHPLPFSLDQLSSTLLNGLLGGVNLDSETRRIAGAKALMLPYALRHSTREEEALAEKWELKLADFLLGFRSPLIQADWSVTGGIRR